MAWRKSGGVAPGDKMLELAVDIAEQGTGAKAEKIGPSQSLPSSSFMSICQEIASSAVRNPPAGLKPIFMPVSSR